MTDPVTASQAVAKAADYAALQSDRWLFVALLIIFLGAIAFIVNWFMKRDALLREEIKEARAESNAVRKEFNDFLQNRHANMATAMEANTLMLGKSMTALENASTTLKQVADIIERRKDP